MKIVIYIDNENISTVDCSDLEKGNPGIGGTEYCILLLAQLYKKYYPNNKIIIIGSKAGKFPFVDEIIVQKDLLKVPETVSQICGDYLVISSVYKGNPLTKEFFNKLTNAKVKSITWGHNYYLSDYCNLITKCKYVVANVFVGRQQYDRYLDHKVIFKSTYIYNMYPIVNNPIRKDINEKIVTYVGSLIPTKGFHLLANAWKDILKASPNAKLHVVGSGKLYDRFSILGKYGIAEASYEESFIRGITDDEGKILNSVVFHGVMGEEKKYLIAQTSVGVPNPSGRTETFGISALDFSSRGVPVVTMATGGFLDTVIHKKTGLLYSNYHELAENIIKLLNDDKCNIEYGQNGIQFVKQFEPQQIIKKWNDIFVSVSNRTGFELIMPVNFTNNNLKQFRILNRKIKHKLNIEYPFTIIGLETVGRNLLRKIKG